MQAFGIGIHVEHGHVVRQTVLHRMLRPQRENANLESLGGEMFCSQQAHFLSTTRSQMGQHHPEIIHDVILKRP